jgi:hypothetical protein
MNTPSGASVFRECVAGDLVSIAAGTIDTPTGLTTALQIYIDGAGDYYIIDATIPQHADDGSRRLNF